MVVVLAGLFMGCSTLLSPSICYVMLCPPTSVFSKVDFLLRQNTIFMLYFFWGGGGKFCHFLVPPQLLFSIFELVTPIYRVDWVGYVYSSFLSG